MAKPVMTNNAPSAGHISWEAFNIQYDGVGYAVSAGSTDQRWVWWRFNGGAPAIEAGADIPANLTDDDLLLFRNSNGVAFRVQASNLVDGELIVDGSILADAIAVNQINSAHIITAGLDAGVIKFGEMSGGRITVGTLNGNRITANSVTANQIASRSIGTKQLAVGGENRANDPGFESGDFTQHSITSNASIGRAFETVVKRSGLQALKHTVLTAFSAGISAMFTNGAASDPLAHPLAKPGEVWRGGVWARCSTGATLKLRMSVQYRKISDPSVTFLGHYADYILLTDQWVWYPMEGAYPEDAGEDAYVMAQIALSDGAVGNIAYYDDIELVKRYDGSLLVDGSVTADAIAADTITANEIAAGSITTAEIAADAITANELAADAVTATHLTGKYLSAVILDIEDAIFAQPGFLDVKAQLMEAESAIFHDNVTRRGTNNFLQGLETAASGVTDPGTPPTLSATWPNVQMAGSPAGVGLFVDDAANEAFVLRNTGNVASIQVFNKTAGALIRTIASSQFAFTDTPYDITGDANWIYLATRSTIDLRVHIYRYDRFGVRDGTFDFDLMAADNMLNPQALAIAVSNGRLHTIHISSALAYRYRRIVIATLVSEQAFTTLPDISATSMGSLAGLDAEWTGAGYKLRLQPYHTARIQWSTQTMTLTDSADRALPFGETLVGSHETWTLDLFGKLYTHYRNSDSLGSKPYKYTWYDSDAGGLGLGESRPSPVRNYTAPKGAGIVVKTPMPPDDGTNDAPNTVRIYIDDWLQAPHYTEAELTSGRMFTVPATVTTASPSDSDFDDRASVTPGGYKSAKGDADGPIWSQYGDGTSRLGKNIKIDANGNWLGTGAASTVLTPTMSGVASHNVRIKEILPGVVLCWGYLDVDDTNLTRRDTGMVIPVGMRPAAQLIDASPQFGTTGKYRYFFGTDGMIEFEQTVANNGPFEGFSVVWTTT